MLEREHIQQRGFRNTYVDGEAVGFQVRVRQVDYRGTWLSQLRVYGVEVDGELFGPDKITIIISGIEYTPEELGKFGKRMWPLNETAILNITKPGGLDQGNRKVSVYIKSIKSYLPPRFDTAGLNFIENVGMMEKNEHNTRELLIV